MSSPVALALSSYDRTTVFEVIKNNPIWKTVDNSLGYAFIELSNSKPYDADKMAYATAELEDDTSISLIKTVDWYQQPIDEPFKRILRQVIFDVIKLVFSEVIPDIESSNPFLVSALISGARICSGLCNSSVQSGMITHGLHFEGEHWKETISKEMAEVSAIHAALHLLAGGSRIYCEEQIG